MKDIEIETVIELFNKLLDAGVRIAYGSRIVGLALNVEAEAFRSWFPDFASVTVETGEPWKPYRRYVAVKDGIEFSCLSAEPIYEEEQK